MITSHTTTTEPITSYPLVWPAGRPRTVRRSSSRFSTSSRRNNTGHSWINRSKPTVAVGRDNLLSELRLLGAKKIIISTNIETKRDGTPYSNQREPNDPGVAVYFVRGEKEMVFACDRWYTVGENLIAIARTIEALRGIARWGTGDMIEAAFTGFAALPSSVAPDPPWRVVLGFETTEIVSIEQAEAAYIRVIRSAHPDTGGTNDQARVVNGAIDRARKELNL